MLWRQHLGDYSPADTHEWHDGSRTQCDLPPRLVVFAPRSLLDARGLRDCRTYHNALLTQRAPDGCGQRVIRVGTARNDVAIGALGQLEPIVFIAQARDYLAE